MTENIWEGPNVRLRALEPEDWQFFHEWKKDSETQRLVSTLDFPESAARSQEWARGIAVGESKYDADRFLVIESLRGETAGLIASNNVSHRHRNFSHGMAVHETFRRRGFAAEAVLIFLDFYLNELDFRKSNARVAAVNEPSIRLHRKLGFVQEGRLRQVAFVGGERQDAICFGMTREEFVELHGDWRAR